MIKNLKNININCDSKIINVEYELIESKILDAIVYGFKVKSTDLETNDIIVKEFLDFTKDLNYAENIFDSLVDNEVLPLNLINVLDNIID